MKLEHAEEIKKKTDDLYVGFMHLLEDYQRELNFEDFEKVRMIFGHIFTLMYFDCLRTHVYSVHPSLEPK